MEENQNQQHTSTVVNQSLENVDPCIGLLQNLGEIGNENLALRETAKKSLPTMLEKFLSNLAQIQNNELKQLSIQKIWDLIFLMMDSNRIFDKLAGIIFFKELLQKDYSLFLTELFEEKFIIELKKLLKHTDVKLRTNISQLMEQLIKFNYQKYFSEFFNLCIKLGNECFIILQNISLEQEREAIEPKNIQEISQYLEKQKMNIMSDQISYIDGILQYLCSLLTHMPKEKQLTNNEIIEIIKLMNQISTLEKKHLKAYSFEMVTILFNKIMTPQIIELKDEWNKLLATGIEDQNAEVRFKALQVVREYMKILKQNSDPSTVYKILLPRICFNRYYPASSLNMLSQDIWREVVGKNGRQLLIEYSEDTISFYESQLGAKNWEVRLTACEDIREFCQKVAVEESSHKILLKYLKKIFENLVACLNDQHLQVRMAAFTLLEIIFPEISYLNKEEQHQIEEFIEQKIIIHLADMQNIKETTSKLLAKIIAKKDVYVLSNIIQFQGDLEIIIMKLEELFSRKAEGHNYCNHEDIKVVVNKEAPNCCEGHYHQGDLIEGTIRLLNLIYLPTITDKQKLTNLRKLVAILSKYFYHIKNETNSSIKSTIWMLLTKTMQQIGKESIQLYGNQFLLECFEGLQSFQFFYAIFNLEMQSNEYNQAKSFILMVNKIIGDEQFSEVINKLPKGEEFSKLYLEKIK